MKKFIKTLAATLATVLVFGMTVSAAGSPSTTTTPANTIPTYISVNTQDIQKAGATKAILADGSTVKPEMVALGEEYEKAFKEFAQKNGLGDLVASFDMTVKTEGDFKLMLKVAMVSKGTELSLLHMVDGQIHTHALTATGEDNTYISDAIDHNSPFAIVVGKASTTTAVVAPKTGEVIALSAIIAIIMMAGAVVCAKKARLQK